MKRAGNPPANSLPGPEAEGGRNPGGCIPSLPIACPRNTVPPHGRGSCCSVGWLSTSRRATDERQVTPPGAFHVCLWTFTMTEAWGRGVSPWDDGSRRPSHADKRRAWRRELLATEVHAALRPG